MTSFFHSAHLEIKPCFSWIHIDFFLLIDIILLHGYILYFVYLLTGEHLRFFSSCRLLQKNCYECLYSGLCADIDFHFSWGETGVKWLDHMIGVCLFQKPLNCILNFAFPSAVKEHFKCSTSLPILVWLGFLKLALLIGG